MMGNKVLAELLGEYEKAQNRVLEASANGMSGLTIAAAHWASHEAAEPLIAAFEAQNTAQQQRIEALEAGLRDTESMLYQAHQLLGSSWSFMLQNDLIQPVDLAQMLIDAVERWNVQYAARNTADPLRAGGEKGGGG